MKPAPLSLCLASAIVFSLSSAAQTSGTGMLNGTVVDASGTFVSSATLTVTNENTKEEQTVSSNGLGLFVVPLLPPGTYRLTAKSEGFTGVTYVDIPVDVGTTTTFQVRLLPGVKETVGVRASAASEDASPNMGSVTDREFIANLPLSTRNYTQILGLNSGIESEVADAGTVGRGATSYAAGTGSFSTSGADTNDNNFQMDGLDVNDIQGSGLLSRGIPVPNPDAIDEFRVTTQPYDASQGRNSGAAVNVVTRSGSDVLHGTLFEYLRNDAFNANSFFRKATGQPRPALKQNQYGGTLGGPLGIKGLVGFGTYQETQQSDGLDPTCSSSVALPPLTNDRSAAGIGAVFQGQRGYFQNAFGGVGPSIMANGSNINPVALQVLQLKNADGSDFIPTPQKIVSTTGTFDARGLSTFSVPCPYREHQGMANLDWQNAEHHRVAVRSFASNSTTQSTLPTPLLGGAEIPGSPYRLGDHFRTISLADTWIARPSLVNEASFGFNRMSTRYTQQYPFSYSSIGSTVPSYDNAAPVMKISGASFSSSVNTFAGALNTFVAQDALAYSRGRQFLHLGGGIERVQDNQPQLTFYGAQLFLSFADFLLGQNATQNGTAAVCAFAGCGAGYSDIAYSQDTPGTIVRAYRVLSGNFYLQDDVRLTPRLTLNVGLRFERLGDFADKLGHNTSFYPSLVNTSPPAGGTLQGYVVPANYVGTVPAGVTRLGNNYGVNGNGQLTWQPRIGVAWQLPGGDRVIVHAGYGLFRSRITADLYNQSINTPPFARLRQYQGTDSVSASLTLAQPLPPFTITLPSFEPYCPPSSTACTETPVFTGLAPDVVPPMFHRYSLDLETRLTSSLTFDLGYSGSSGRHLLTEVLINQAAIATPSAPVNGQTTTTLANLPYRVPLPGFTTKNLAQYQTSGSAFYNALEASLHQRTSSFGEFLLAYTWARDLTDTYDAIPSTRGGTILGDQTNPENDYGPDLFLRQQRLVVSYFVKLPSPRNRWAAPVLSHWAVTGVGVAQTGHSLTITDQNQFSAYGIATDRAQLVAGCNPVLTGSAESRRTAFFKTACFTTPPVIGNDHIATGFGNSPMGFLKGPRQANLDAAITRTFPISKLREGTAVVFRAEAFNAFNHSQFQDPDTELTNAAFGQILSTSVNPRVIQLAVRVLF